eukprot:68072_1
MTLSQQEAIILGCIIGSFIVIVFGLLLWHFCGDTCTPHQIKPDYSKLHIPTKPVVPHPNSETLEKESQSIETNELSQGNNESDIASDEKSFSGKYKRIREVSEFAYELTDHLGGEPRRNPQCEMTIPTGERGSLPPNPMDWNETDIHQWLHQKGLEPLRQKLHDLEINDGKTLLHNLQDKVHGFGG